MHVSQNNFGGVYDHEILVALYGTNVFWWRVWPQRILVACVAPNSYLLKKPRKIATSANCKHNLVHTNLNRHITKTYFIPICKLFQSKTTRQENQGSVALHQYRTPKYFHPSLLQDSNQSKTTNGGVRGL